MTFSIAAVCSRTQEIGCALATSSMGVGGRCGIVVPERGIVLSQARSDPRLGEVGRQALEAGRDASSALGEMLAASPHSYWRQLAVIDAQGRIASHTGEGCTQERGEQRGTASIAIGNGLGGPAVPAAMMEGFESRPADSLTIRLITSLEAAMGAGGEAFPLRSAVLLVARPGVPFLPINLRVDFSEDPIGELRRLWELWEPMMDSYVMRAMDPDQSPAASQIEGHAKVAA